MRKNVELFRKNSVHDFCGLKALITLEQLITSVVRKKHKKTSVLMSKTSMVRLTESCDEHAVYCR